MNAQLTQTMVDVQLLAARLAETIEPLQTNLDGTHAELILTLQTMRAAMQDTRGFLNTDSGIRYQMDGAMGSLNEAAEALRALVLSLDRNPDMLLRGKRPN